MCVNEAVQVSRGAGDPRCALSAGVTGGARDPHLYSFLGPYFNSCGAGSRAVPSRGLSNIADMDSCGGAELRTCPSGHVGFWPLAMSVWPCRLPCVRLAMSGVDAVSRCCVTVLCHGAVSRCWVTGGVRGQVLAAYTRRLLTCGGGGWDGGEWEPADARAWWCWCVCARQTLALV